MAEDKKDKAAPPMVTPFAPPQGSHKNPTVGPATGKPLLEWRRTRDYENFEPTANK